MVDTIFGKFRGVIHVLIDDNNRAGLRYRIGSPRWQKTIYCWDVESFDRFIKRIERKYPEVKPPMTGGDVLATMRSAGITAEMLSRLSGLSVCKIEAWMRGESNPSRVAARKIKETIRDYRKEKSNASAGAVQHLDELRPQVGEKVRETVRGIGKGQEGVHTPD